MKFRVVMAYQSIEFEYAVAFKT